LPPKRKKSANAFPGAVRRAPDAASALVAILAPNTLSHQTLSPSEESASERSPKCQSATAPNARAGLDQRLTARSSPRKAVRVTTAKNAAIHTAKGVRLGLHSGGSSARLSQRKIMVSASA